MYGFGIDVGGTDIKLGFFTQDGELLEKWSIPTDNRDNGTRILPDIVGAVIRCLERHGISQREVLGLGIGVPGPVDADGVVGCCLSLGWGRLDLAKALGELSGLPVRAGNDANLAALGEAWMGGGKGCRHMLMVTLGTGIGGGLVYDGTVISGSHGLGGEIGHITVNPAETEPCPCGKFGCVQQYASATGIVDLAKRKMQRSKLQSVLFEQQTLCCQGIFDAAARGDKLAADILDEAYDYLGEAIADACCVFDPELILLGGGVSKAGKPLLDGVTEAFHRHMFHANKKTPVALAALGNDAGIYGACRLLFRSFEGSAFSPKTAVESCTKDS